MKSLLSTLFALSTISLCFSQPNMTLWITPDGYHTDHNHETSQQYFCDSGYYIFYHPKEDTLFITAKNDGTETLEITGINTTQINGASFEVIEFSDQHLLPGEMYTLKVLYQLPSVYISGINGQISLDSNDPNKPTCALYFDIGCAVDWNFRVNPFLGVNAGCDEPIVLADYNDNVVNANLIFEDSFAFYAYNQTEDTSYQIMKLSDYGVVLRKDVIAYDHLYAGSTGNGSENALHVDKFGVDVNRYLTVNAKLHLIDILDADNGISCTGDLDVVGNTPYGRNPGSDWRCIGTRNAGSRSHDQSF